VQPAVFSIGATGRIFPRLNRQYLPSAQREVSILSATGGIYPGGVRVPFNPYVSISANRIVSGTKIDAKQPDNPVR